MERTKQLMEMVAKYESLIYDTADYIWKNPETGYREWKTSAYMEEHFEALGYTLTKACLLYTSLPVLVKRLIVVMGMGIKNVFHRSALL